MRTDPPHPLPAPEPVRSGAPDLLGITLVHRAMRGDARALAEAMARFADGTEVCTPDRAAAVRGHLHEICDVIHHHHRAEDDVLWPVLERSASSAVELAGLTDDHAALDPVLDRIRVAAAANGWRLSGRACELGHRCGLRRVN
jgi:hypothetical protein